MLITSGLITSLSEERFGFRLDSSSSAQGPPAAGWLPLLVQLSLSWLHCQDPHRTQEVLQGKRFNKNCICLYLPQNVFGLDQINEPASAVAKLAFRAPLKRVHAAAM